MTFTEVLCNRHNWLEALGLCLLFHLFLGILLSGITYHAPRINTVEPVISIIPLTETVEEPQVDYGVVQQPTLPLHVSNKVIEKIQTAAPVSRMSAGNIAHQAQKMSTVSSIEPQKQPDSAVSPTNTKEQNVSSISLDSFKKGDSQLKTEKEDIYSAENTGAFAHTADSLNGNGEKSNVAAAGNKKATSADMLADYKQYLKASIECAKQYPLIARRRGDEGRVAVAFELDSSGRLLTSKIERSSGSAVLDEAAIRAVMSAAPFSKPPVEDSPLSFVVVLDFRLSNRS